MKKFFGASGLVAASFVLMVGVAVAALVGPIDFETYALGNIHGQNGWMKTGGYDVEVADVSLFPNAAAFGFGTKALRLSNGVASGSFGDQTFSPGLAQPTGETQTDTHFEASFDIGSTQAAQQPGLFMSVSPDDGQGSRMSYVGFDDQADGIHVIFYDVTNPGPLGTVANFNGTDVVTLDRATKHTVKFVIDFVPGSANDVVNLYVDGVLEITGTTWEDYYRYDPEQSGNGNIVPVTQKLLFREGGSSVPSVLGQGYLVDNVMLLSGVPLVSPTDKNQCKRNGWKAFNNPVFKNQGDCVSYMQSNGQAVGNKEK